MRKILVIIYLLVTTCSLSAQEGNMRDMSAMLENRIWKIKLPEDKLYAIEMEFRDALWTSVYLYDGLRKETKYSYTLCSDTIKIFESRQNYKILALTDSTLTIQYLPKSPIIGDGLSKYVTDNSLSGQRKNENRLDSIWRKESILNLGYSITDGEDLEAIEPPRWAKWDYDLEGYFVSQMKYPTQLLAKNKAGYSIAMFTIDTLGLPDNINILTTIHKDFDKEVVRLIKELPHCLPCRDKNGKRIRCLYTVYVPFLPQHYKDKVKADSIAAEELKNCFVEWEEQLKFQDGNPFAITNYIYERLTYDPKFLGEAKQVRGTYTIRVNSYGEVTESETLRSCGIQAWDNQVVQIIKGMPHWTPTIHHRGKGEYRSALWTIPVIFKNNEILIAHTTERYLEAGVPVCYLNERGDTIIPYGKYKFCHTDTIKNIGFVYDNRYNASIVCIDVIGNKLFNVFKCDNGPDYVKQGFFRIVDDDGLIGFSDTLGNVIIKPQFKFAFPFNEGKAKVTFEGEYIEVPESKGEKRYWESNEWYYIDKAGKVLP